MYDLLIAFIVLAIATYIATYSLPNEFAAIASSPLFIFAAVLLSVGALQIYPVIGFAIFILTVVLFFKRNAHAYYNANHTVTNKTINDESTQSINPYESDKLGPYDYGYDGIEPEVGAPVGMYPIEEDRPVESQYEQTFTYMPDEDTGSNKFVRFGPDIDEKSPTSYV